MAKTHILILLTWTLLQAVVVCDTANTCAAVRPCDNAENIKSLESKMEKKLSKLQAALTKQNTHLKSQLQGLRTYVGPKLGFSASLAGESAVDLKPGSPQTIVFKNVFFNQGNAYNSRTGIFTAPQKGAYQFTFATLDFSSYYSGARLVKNGHVEVSTWTSKGHHDSTSGAVILSLNDGDTVKVMVMFKAHSNVYDNSLHFTTFSGFLLFPM